MQIILFSITIILSIILYKMLSSRRATYPFVRTKRIIRTEGNPDFCSTETEHGLITIDGDVVIVEDQEYLLKGNKEMRASAFLHLENGKLISISISFPNGEKQYFIDPEHGVFTLPYRQVSDSSQHPLITV